MTPTAHDLLVARRQSTRAVAPPPDPPRREIDRSKVNVPLGVPQKHG